MPRLPASTLRTPQTNTARCTFRVIDSLVLSDAEETLQAVTHRYVGYTEIVRSGRAVRDDVDAGVPKPSPNDVNYLSAVCGSPTGTRPLKLLAKVRWRAMRVRFAFCRAQILVTCSSPMRATPRTNTSPTTTATVVSNRRWSTTTPSQAANR
jgi:hypothetical protein